jgi:type VI secretion system secreted protein VgrG
VAKKLSMTVGGDETRTVSGGRKTNITKDDELQVAANRKADISKDDTIKAGKVITIDAGDKILITAANEIKLSVGQSTMVMKKNGNIEISGMKIEIKGSQSVKSEAAQITSDASAVNTIKGGLVKIN